MTTVNKDHTYNVKYIGGTIRFTGRAMEAVHKELTLRLWQSVECMKAYLNYCIMGQPYRVYRRGKLRCKHCGLFLKSHKS